MDIYQSKYIVDICCIGGRGSSVIQPVNGVFCPKIEAIRKIYLQHDETDNFADGKSAFKLAIRSFFESIRKTNLPEHKD